MRIGILSDTHDEIERTRRAVNKLRDAGAEALIHCGDLSSPPIIELCSALPCWFTFGNHDSDMVPQLRSAALQYGVKCLEWGDVIELDHKRIGIVHGHMTTDLRRVVNQQPDYLLFGHFHFAVDVTDGPTRRINPGALHRADCYSVAILEPSTGELQNISIDDLH